MPVAQVLPGLDAETLAKVSQWDAARMSLQGEYEAADGEYLMLIRNALKPRRGAWYAYLRARGIPDSTATDRIRKAEGRFIASPRAKAPVTGALSLAPAPSYDDDGWPPHDATWDADDTPAPEPQPVRVTPVHLPVISVPQSQQEHSVPSVTTYSVEAWAELHPALAARDGRPGADAVAGG